jgi:hypothetical protein
VQTLNPQEKKDSLSRLQGRSIGNYEIHIELEPFRYRGGWTHFSLFLKDQQGGTSSQRTPSGNLVARPVIEGIHSRGGRGISGWIEVGDYYPVVYFPRRGFSPRNEHLSREGMDRAIFRLLARCIPPGGHLMFAYEVSYDSPFHRETQEDLIKGVPPVSTAQGELLFHAGCRLVKDWYLAEGGHEGPRKLWGEKPLNEDEARAFDLRTFLQIVAFLSHKPNPASLVRERRTRRSALRIMGKLSLEPALSSLRMGIVDVYRKRVRSKSLESAAPQTCRQIEDMLKQEWFEDGRTREGLSQIARDCSGKASYEED